MSDANLASIELASIGHSLAVVKSSIPGSNAGTTQPGASRRRRIASVSAEHQARHHERNNATTDRPEHTAALLLECAYISMR